MSYNLEISVETARRYGAKAENFVPLSGGFQNTLNLLLENDKNRVSVATPVKTNLNNFIGQIRRLAKIYFG